LGGRARETETGTKKKKSKGRRIRRTFDKWLPTLPGDPENGTLREREREKGERERKE
jgi:hypothetical protein